MRVYTNIDSIRAHPPSYIDPFIVQWEIPTPRDNVHRRYIVFDGIAEYISYHNKGRYNTCHEVFIHSTYQTDRDITGHPAFDIDKKLKNDIIEIIPEGWEYILQEDIVSILCKQYPTKEEDIKTILSNKESSPWIWMTSPNKDKISRHLTISRIVFNTWRSQMKMLITDLIELKPFYKSILDQGIYRAKGSLRLPLNSKVKEQGISNEIDPLNAKAPIYSAPIQLDNPSHTFLDGLIMIHESTMYTLSGGLMLTPSDLAPEYQDKCGYVVPIVEGVNIDEDIDISNASKMEQAFYLMDKRWNTGLTIGKSQGKYITLIRKHPGKCPISERIHEGDNAYIFSKGEEIFYACYRDCIYLEGKIEKKYLDITPYAGSSMEDHAIKCSRHIGKSLKDEDDVTD